MKKTILLLMKKTTLLLTAVATVFAVEATPAFAADPDVSPMGACGYGDYNYVNTSYGYVFTRASGTQSAVSGDPGVTISISTSTSFTVSGTLGGNTQISASIVVLTVQQSMSISITAGFTRTTTNSGAFQVPWDWTNRRNAQDRRAEILGQRHEVTAPGSATAATVNTSAGRLQRTAGRLVLQDHQALTT